ncbi:MAG TPA: histidine kinase [Capillimicrobium sp.]|nr:histidine kinase [Capillimicrobium sp.]
MDIAVPAAAITAHGSARRGRVVAGALAIITATAITAAIAATGAHGHAALVALARAAIVFTPCAVGLYAWRRRPGERFGLLLIAAGATCFAANLAESRDAGPYTAGRAAGWLMELVFVYLILAFPTGRLPGRADRLLVVATAIVVAVAFAPRLVLAADFEVPSPYTSCTAGCPPNAVFPFAHEPAVVDAVLRPGGAVLVSLVMLAVVGRLWSRAVAASPLARRMFAPALAIAMLRAALLAAAIAVRAVDPDAPGLEAVAWLLALALPALALAFLAGLLRWQIFTAGVLGRLALAVREEPDGSWLRRAFARAFEDPGVDVVFPASADAPVRWTDADGAPVRLPAAGSGRAVTVIEVGGRPAAAVIHDEALRSEPLLLRAGSAIGATAIDRRRLIEEVGSATREVRRSRARIAASADRERRRLERDLHDGAQQRLVALRIELQLAEELVRRDADAAAGRLRELEAEVDDAIDELRALAHGVYPPLLADRGLPEALRAAMRRSPLPVELAAHRVGRYSPEIESAVYFCVLEAWQNALKHADGARRVEVELDQTAGELRFSVRDDGAGLPRDGAPSDGQGLANMRDRVAAAGGDLAMASAPHVGTVLRGHVPIPMKPEVR